MPTMRMRRFERVDGFLAYLMAEEQRESRLHPTITRVSGWGFPFMPSIVKQIAVEKKIIRAKYAKYYVSDDKS